MAQFNGSVENIENNKNKINDLFGEFKEDDYPTAAAVIHYLVTEYYNRHHIDLTQKATIKTWQPNTEYTEGDLCVAMRKTDSPNMPIWEYIRCTKNHISSNSYNDDRQFFWGIMLGGVQKALSDANNKVIHETYATKDELKDVSSPDLSNYYTKVEIDTQIGDIETALDTIIAEQEAIIAIQKALIGGDGQ